MKRSLLWVVTLLTLSSLSSCEKNSSSSSEAESSASDSSESLSSSSSDSESSSVSESQSSSSSSESSSESSITSSSEAAEPYFVTYKHVFKQADFVTSGGTTAVINGLTWTYSAFSFLGGATQGVQIGSAKNPQLNDWTLSTVFPTGISVTSFSSELCNASGGSATYTAAFGDYVSTGAFASMTLTPYGVSDLNIPSDFFTFTLKSTVKAMYFYSLEFTLSVPGDISLDIYGDEVNALPVTPGVNGIPGTQYALTPLETYYGSTNLTLNGDYLVLELRTLISVMTKKSYGDAKTILQYTDENPAKPGYDYGMWDGDNIYATWDNGASWNREHVWACAQMQLNGVDPRPDEDTKNHATDLYNLRVACQLANGMHGNKFFDETNSDITMFPNITEGLNGHHAYTGDFRGDLARTLFYMCVRYEGLQLNSDLDINNNVSMGKLSALLLWNQADPVDTFEAQRNNRIFEYQGNRNPFIDYPNLATQIWTA